MHSNGEIFYIDQLILSPYTLFLVEEPQIPKNVQKVDTLLLTLALAVILTWGPPWPGPGEVHRIHTAGRGSRDWSLTRCWSTPPAYWWRWTVNIAVLELAQAEVGIEISDGRKQIKMKWPFLVCWLVSFEKRIYLQTLLISFDVKKAWLWHQCQCDCVNLYPSPCYLIDVQYSL